MKKVKSLLYFTEKVLFTIIKTYPIYIYIYIYSNNYELFALEQRSVRVSITHSHSITRKFK